MTDDTKSSKSPKRPPGRPRSSNMVHITAKVPLPMFEKLREWGGGNISAGIRAAVEKALRAEETMQAAKHLDSVLYGQTSGYTRATWTSEVEKAQQQLHKALGEDSDEGQSDGH